MKIKKIKFIFLLIIIYPLFYTFSIVTNKIDTSFANLYFGLVFISISIFVLTKKYFIIRKYHRINLSILVTVIFLVAFNYSSIRYTKPLFIFIFIFILYLFMSSLKNISINFYNSKALKIVLFGIIFVSTPLTLVDLGYSDLGRFQSFLISPTLFSVILDIVFLIYAVSNQNKIFVLLVYITMVIFHILSETRLNTLFIIMIPFIYYFILNKSNTFKSIFIICYIIGLNLIYPIYNFYTINYTNNVFASRYNDNRDASFGLRFSLFNTALNNYISGSAIEKTLGKGAEYTRKLIRNEYGTDLLAHNDYLRFLIDFGFITLFLYLIFLIRLSLTNNLTFLLVLLYLLIFYHNMIYSYFMTSLIVLSSFLKNKRSEDDA